MPKKVLKPYKFKEINSSITTPTEVVRAKPGFYVTVWLKDQEKRMGMKVLELPEERMDHWYVAVEDSLGNPKVACYHDHLGWQIVDAD